MEAVSVQIQRSLKGEAWNRQTTALQGEFHTYWGSIGSRSTNLNGERTIAVEQTPVIRGSWEKEVGEGVFAVLYIEHQLGLVRLWSGKNT